MKMWHDDVRQPPDDTWTWVKSNNEAKKLLTENLDDITEISLDHDLGANMWDIANMTQEERNLLKGSSEDNGLMLVRWMASTRAIPTSTCKITIHSWNAYGAKCMQKELSDLGVVANLEPYSGC